ncbi:MAG TPA: hypothetical protein V6C84_15925 [Coleofasciculaceae cyanobacterium]|jgi:hypothetical protein
MILPPKVSSVLFVAGTISFSSLAFWVCPPSNAQSPTPSVTPTHSNPQPSSPVETRSPCDAFSTRQEAQAFFERDPVSAARLDPNQDGIACDQLSATLRTDGYRSASGSTSDGWFYEIWQSSVRSAYAASGDRVVYYIKAWRSGAADTVLTTRNFSSAQAAYEYFADQLR